MSFVCSAWRLLNMTFAVLRCSIAAYPLYSISPEPLHPWCLATRLAGVGGRWEANKSICASSALNNKSLEIFSSES